MTTDAADRLDVSRLALDLEAEVEALRETGRALVEEVARLRGDLIVERSRVDHACMMLAKRVWARSRERSAAEWVAMGKRMAGIDVEDIR